MSYESERVFAQKLSNTFLSTDKVKVSYSQQNIAFANVSKKQIWFDFRKIFGNPDQHPDDDEIFRAMMSFKGLLFHEIHHIKHTTNYKHIKKKAVNVRKVAGWLEDGRIETLAVLSYDKLADYFNFAVNNYIIKGCKPNKLRKDATVFTHVLLYGRKLFLEDLKFLKITRKLMMGYFGKTFTLKIEDIIDKYIYEKDAKERVKLAEEFAKLFFGENIDPDDNMGHMFGNNDMVFRPAQAPKTLPQDLKELQEDMKQAQGISLQIVVELRQGDPQMPDNSGKREKFDKAKQKASDRLEKKKEKLAEKTNKLWDGYYNEQDMKKKKKIQYKINKLNKKSLEAQQNIHITNDKEYEADPDMVKEILTQGHKDGSIPKTIEELGEKNDSLVERQIPDLISDIKLIGRSLDNVYSDTTFNTTKHMIEVKNRLEHGLKKMNNELVKGYVSGMKSGKINIKRFINRKNRADTKVFKKFKPDKIRQTKLLINLYVDGSASMHQQWKKALSTLWIINEAMNRDENKVMCYEFSNRFIRFKDYDNVLTIPRFLSGGTHPEHAILDSIPIIEKYKRKHGYKHVIDIIITDGSFCQRRNNDAIAQLNKLGHETILINVKSRDPECHNAKHMMYVDSFDVLADKLIKMFKVIKKNIIKKVRVM